jgi:microcompartment protein CcmL/EutN
MDRSPAVAVIELASLARAVVVLDQIVKRSPVRIHTAARVSPGKFLILVQGGVAEVEEGFEAGLTAAEGVLVAKLLLPQAHVALLDALEQSYPDVAIDSLGLFETYTASAALESADAALKATGVDIVGLHLCTGIGGKGYWAVSGQLHAVEAAIETAHRTIEQAATVTGEVIARPHPEAIDAYLAPWRWGLRS